MKIETWLGHDIRFVEKVPGDWWAVLSDISKALALSSKWVKQRLEDEVVSTHLVADALGRKQEMLIVNEYGIYETVFESRKKEAKEFKRWVFDVIKHLRRQTGLEAFQMFRMLDKEHQRVAMERLCRTLKEPVQVDFIKANQIANKAVSTKFGHPKMVKKGSMSPEMLVERQPILEETIELMGMKDRYGLDFSVSAAIYERHTH